MAASVMYMPVHTRPAGAGEIYVQTGAAHPGRAAACACMGHEQRHELRQLAQQAQGSVGVLRGLLVAARAVSHRISTARRGVATNS